MDPELASTPDWIALLAADLSREVARLGRAQGHALSPGLIAVARLDEGWRIVARGDAGQLALVPDRWHGHPVVKQAAA